MIASLLIVFREVLEAGLIVGIILAATQGVPRRGIWIWGGILGGILGALLIAAFAGELSNAFAGSGQEIFNATVLLVAVAMLAWHTIWMSSHGREMAKKFKTMGQEASAGQRSLLAVAVVVGVAVLREGAEVVLFLYGVAAANNEGPLAMLAGGAMGIAMGAAVSWLLYLGLVAIPLRHLFSVTNWLIALLAAGMAGQAAAILANADLIPSWGYELWDTSAFLPEDSLIGRALHALVGYADRPMGIQLAVQLTVLALFILGARFVANRLKAAKPVLPAHSAKQHSI